MQAIILALLSSCIQKEPLEVQYSFQTAENVTYDVSDFDKVEFNSNNNLDLGFYNGTVWIKLSIANGKEPTSLVVLCNDLINRDYSFYTFDKAKNTFVSYRKELDRNKYDDRSFNFAKPNFQIDLASSEESTFLITASSDGRILQATPRLISLNEFQSIRQQGLIFDVVFYGIIAIILLINLIYFQMVRNTIYYFYGVYILSSCVMYLFVEGRLYGLGISHAAIDHLMFVAIRVWILTGILFAVKFLETKITNPKFYKFLIAILILTLGGSTIYQFSFPNNSISFLHKTENIIGFIWIVLSLINVGLGYKTRKLESIYYLISYTLFLFFITLGLIDSHTTMLPGDPFSYFKIGTVLEFIGFTYFISALVRKKLEKTEYLESTILENREELDILSEELKEKVQILSSKTAIKKTDLIGIFNLLENSLTTESDWEAFKQQLKDLNPVFLEQLLANFPDLTKSEIRLLTLIKVGYSQKEIATILSIAPGSVKKAKSRVRKKLGLGESTTLVNYLISIDKC